MKILLALLLASVQPSCNCTVLCYTCQKICGPVKDTWDVVKCEGRCHEEITKMPGSLSAAAAATTASTTTTSVAE